MPITLTSQQSEDLELMLDFATNETQERMFLLEGFADTGKSSTWNSVWSLSKAMH